MAKYLKKFETTSAYNTYINGSDVALPNVSMCKDAPNIIYYNSIDFSKQYLTFEIVTAGTITIKASSSSIAGKNISYSVDGGDSWTSLTTSTSAQTIGTTYQAGQKILLKGLNNTYATSSSSIQFDGTAQYKVYGNIMSLIYGDDFIGQTSFPTGSTYNFRHLFYYSAGLIDASNLILPATALTQYCYTGMFQGCSGLTTVPSTLPATTLSADCYSYMFGNCTSLTATPELPATTLANWCYAYMFQGCTSLTKAPELPATTLAGNCYYHMFYKCTSLTTAPALPATTLANDCYGGMFDSCTNLTEVAIVPNSVKPVSSNYCHNMYSNCNVPHSSDYNSAAYATGGGSND